MSEALIKQVSCMHADSPCGIVSAHGVPNDPTSQILLLSALRRQIAICHHVPNWLTCNPSHNIVSVSENHYQLRHCPHSTFTTMVPFWRADSQCASANKRNSKQQHTHALACTMIPPFLDFIRFNLTLPHVQTDKWLMLSKESFTSAILLSLRLIASVIRWNKR